MRLKIKGLNYSYENNKVLKNLKLETKKGKIHAILGANGSGKSTLLKLINGLMDPDSGIIVFDNKPIKGPRYNLIPGNAGISMVRQDSSLFPLHTVRENLQYVLQAHNSKTQSGKIRDLSRLLDLDNYLGRALKFLSGGEQQRVSIAAALASNPNLILMDEPFSQTDLYLKKNLKYYIQSIVKQMGISILYVTHDPQDALGFADEIMILDKGKILEKGNSEEIYYFPKYKSTAILTGHCNWLPVDDFKFLSNHHIIKSHYLIRPDQIRVNPSDQKEVYKSTIEKIDFHGEYQLLHLFFKNQYSLITIQVSNHEDLHVGQELNISF